MTEAHVCKQLDPGCTRQRGGRDSNPRPVDRKSGSLTTRPPSGRSAVELQLNIVEWRSSDSSRTEVGIVTVTTVYFTYGTI